MRAAVHHPSCSKDSGFALLVVIWVVGLLSLIASTLITTSHYRLKATSNAIESAKAARLAEAGIGLAELALAGQLSGSPLESSQGASFGLVAGSREPVLCMLPTGASAAILAEDEGGKLDLNLAQPELIAALLRGLGASEQEAPQLAASIARFARVSINKGHDEAEDQAYAADGRTFGPKRAPFDTPLELDQVVGMRRALLEALLPYVTVFSHHPGIDPRLAAPALLAALAGRPSRTVQALAQPPATRAQLAQQIGEIAAEPIPADLVAPSSRTSFLINVEVMTPGAGYFAREAIVEWQGASARLATREWRRGRGRFRQILAAQIDHQRRALPRWPRC
ncbi:type II secretion system minor pseudopilin [Bradyrhizobium brasilense]|uniref:Type II secretion system protein GspK n=1 Tax=Bradyrhizobium brasilense TaxID=1419277 RepID=A0ABY8JQC9_9BRAD|nr:type II secretion system protein GspK [Bradyrhizobium brasilense]WFU66686.1 type II secretion system protein GspK [Bradyrhizobium brasilense]